MLISLDDLKEVRETNKNKVIVAGIGSFDLFHYEHLRFLQDAKKLGDLLVVIIKDDYLVSLKGYNRPIIPIEQRAALIDELACVDYVVIATKDVYEKTKLSLNVTCNKDSFEWLCMFNEIFKHLCPDILYHEDTHKYDFARNYITKYGTKLVERKRTAIVTTSAIIEKIVKNNT